MFEKIFNLEDRFVRYAGEMILFTDKLPKNAAGRYYIDQLLRALGSTALNYGETQATNTIKEFIHKAGTVLRELREGRVGLKVLTNAKTGNADSRDWLLQETQELMAIVAKMILNKKREELQ